MTAAETKTLIAACKNAIEAMEASLDRFSNDEGSLEGAVKMLRDAITLAEKEKPAKVTNTENFILAVEEILALKRTVHLSDDEKLAGIRCWCCGDIDKVKAIWDGHYCWTCLTNAAANMEDVEE